MSPRVTSYRDASKRRVPGQRPDEPDWLRWEAPLQPPVPTMAGPWNDDISALPVDRQRTRRLVDVDVPLKCEGGGRPWEGSSYGATITPFTRSTPSHLVWDDSRGFVDNLVSPLRVQLPEWVRREGDPVGSSDRHVWLHDVERRRLVELIQFDDISPRWGTTLRVGYAGGGRGAVTWDLSKPWDPRTAPRGVVAANVPQLIHAFGWERIRGGGGCLFGTLPNVRRGFVGWARGGDGDLGLDDTPVCTGDLLRLTCEAYIELCALHPVGTPARAIVDRLFTHGFVVGDTTSDGGAPDVGAASLLLTMDRRWVTGEGDTPPLADLKLRLSMFELVLITNT